jgi:hypothetical protein
MEGLTGLAAVIMFLGMPTAILAMYTFYRVRKLRTDERMAAMQRGVAVPMEPELSEMARSRRSGILFIAGAVPARFDADPPRREGSVRIFL